MQKSLWIPILIVLMLATPVDAGTAGEPELRDAIQDARAPPPQCPTGSTHEECTSRDHPDLDIVRAWIEPRGKDFHFILELISLPTLENLEKQNTYTFHFTFGSARLFFTANATDDGTGFEYHGGSYQGCRQPTCPEWTYESDRNYHYVYGNSSFKDIMRGEYEAGTPGRITWILPMDQFGEDRRGLAFKGIMIRTTQLMPPRGVFTEGYQRAVDVAEAQEDYEHKIYTPWWSKFVPGPSPLLVAAAAVGALAVARHYRRPQ